MSSTRSITAPPPFAANALTVIPPTPVAGVSYRDTIAGPASSPDGWPYAERVNSAEWNQIMYQISSLVSIMDKKGVLGWSSSVNYTEPSIQFGSDGILYLWLQASGPDNGGARDPVSSPAFWQTIKSSLGASTNGISGVFSNLKASAPGNTSIVTISVSEIMLESAAGDFLTVKNVSGTLNASTTGANGIDVASVESGTWYSLWVIYNGSTVAFLASKSTTSPTLPAGYTHKARIGWFRSGTTAGFFPIGFSQAGKAVVYNSTTLPIMGSGVVADNTSVAWANYFPPTVATISMSCRHANGAQLRFSTSPNYDLYYARYKDGITGTGTVTGMVPLGPNIYWGSVAGLDGTPEIRAYGWEDNL